MSLLPVWVGWDNDPEDTDIAFPDEVAGACDGDLARTRPSCRAAVVITESVRPAPVADPSGDTEGGQA